MKLYDFAPAPNPRRVRIFLAEKGVAVDAVQIDLTKGEQRTEEFRAINPAMDVPVLELDDGRRIHQVDAICRYLEETYPDNPLWGRDAFERAQVNIHNHQIMLNGLLAVAEAYRNTTPMFVDRAVPGPHNYVQSPELAERGMLRVANFFNDMDAHFATSEYVVGDYFSIADIQALIVIDFAKWVKVRIAPEQENLQRWYDQVSARPSASA
ncbi:MAG: glutathione S-transferase family protein [Porticoccaceae bacterium]